MKAFTFFKIVREKVAIVTNAKGSVNIGVLVAANVKRVLRIEVQVNDIELVKNVDIVICTKVLIVRNAVMRILKAIKLQRN